MTLIDTLLERNETFAARGFAANPTFAPSLGALIIGCVDPRVDPAHLLGIALGEAAVVRNVGGRVTPDVRRNLALLATLTRPGAQAPAPLHIVVLHHTDCGITRMTNETAKLADFFAIAPADLDAKSITDPYASVALDVAALRADPALPGAWTVSGLVYDVATGRVRVVVPHAPLHDTYDGGQLSKAVSAPMPPE